MVHFLKIPANVNLKNVYKMARAEGYDVNRIHPPTREGKKLSYLNPETESYVNFGNSDYDSYDKHLDKDRRERYLKRASNINGKWSKDKYSPNNLAMKLLWSDKVEL